MNPRSRSSRGTSISRVTKKDLHLIYNGRTRGNKPYEVFAKLYASKVDAEKIARCEAQKIKGRQQLAVWHEVAKELYQSAGSEEIAAVNKEISAAKEVKGSIVTSLGDPSKSPSTFLQCVLPSPVVSYVD